MEKEISLIAFLDEVVSRNTQHYRKDFELDAQKLRDALNSPYMDERIFYFMSRPNGTWCILERDAFLRDSDGYKIWTHYADMPDGIEAYRVTITGRRGTAPMGHVVKLNYREQVQRVIKVAMPVDAVELTFYTGDTIRIPMLHRNDTVQLRFAFGTAAETLDCSIIKEDFFPLFPVFLHRYPNRIAGVKGIKRAGGPKQRNGRIHWPDRRDSGHVG